DLDPLLLPQDVEDGPAADLEGEPEPRMELPDVEGPGTLSVPAEDDVARLQVPAARLPGVPRKEERDLEAAVRGTEPARLPAGLIQRFAPEAELRGSAIGPLAPGDVRFPPPPGSE